MENISRDTILLPRTFSSLTYSRLISLLSENETWKRVARSFGIFSNNDIQNIGGTRRPAETLIHELGARLCPIGFFCDILRECNLYNILFLFKPHDPILIIEQPCNNDEGILIGRGTPLRLTCRATGLPLPNYQWYCNNEKLPRQMEPVLCINDFGNPDSGKRNVFIVVPPRVFRRNHWFFFCRKKGIGRECLQSIMADFICGYHNVEIKRYTVMNMIVERLENEGEYFCIVSQDGYDNVRASNSVVVAMAPEAPVLLVQPAVCTTCKIGSTVVLSVLAKGHPRVRYQWFKGKTEMYESTESTLVLSIKDESFDGIYRCYIYNAAGGLWSDDSKVTVPASIGPEPSAKVALLIANQLYDNLHSLQTPENDVRTLVKILKGLGFHTIALQNLNLTEMRNIVYYFSDILPKNAYVVFYFSGHGFEICDKFMLPVDAPGPEDFLQTHALSERELLRAILNSKPMLFLELLDMCLKAPDPSNKKIFDEKVSLYEYSASHNLIQAYATTSYSGAYEKRTDENGLYVKHLKEYFLKERDMPIVEILRNVAKDIAKVCPIQKPFFGTNVTMDYRLTDRCSDNPEIGEKIKALSVIPPDFILPFKQVSINSKVSLTPFLGVFFNTLQVRFSNLQDFKVSCEVPGDELSLEFSRMNGDASIKIMNIQRLISIKTLTLRLYQNNGRYLDKAAWDINKPMIAAINLQDEVRSRARVRRSENPDE